MIDHEIPRRQFLAATSGSLAAATWSSYAQQQLSGAEKNQRTEQKAKDMQGDYPVVSISSANGLEATKRAYTDVMRGNDTLDAAIAGVAIVEADPQDTSVGFGGLPNENGVVELDAAVMHGPTHRAGAVASIQNIKHPAAVAQKVLERSDHVLLVGQGALEFAKAHGFTEEDLLTDKARKIWLHWKGNVIAQRRLAATGWHANRSRCG